MIVKHAVLTSLATDVRSQDNRKGIYLKANLEDNVENRSSDCDKESDTDIQIKEPNIQTQW
jgi:hypothetical protein